MKTKLKKTCPGVAFAVSILGVALVAMPSSAATPPELTVAVAGSGSVTIDSTGAESYVAPCTAALCSGTVVVGNGTNGLAIGQLNWAGTIGTFTGLITGQTKPYLAAPQIDVLASGLKTGATGGTLTISWTDVGFSVGETPATMNIVGGGSGSTVSSASYVDSTNVPFGTGTLVNTVFGTGTASGPGPSSSPFSMTNVETITLPANIGGSGGPPFSTDFSLQVSPHPPLSIQCGAAAGTVGTPYSSSLVANGGIPPYTYSITGGSLSPLSLNISTGAITGTPTVAGTLNFTATVVDSSGNSGSNTANSSCSIIITTPNTTPPGVCKDDTATIGFWHNKNGQALILSMNGSASSKALANWLATNFPYLYGVHSSNNLTNATNTQVAALFLTYFGAGGQKTSAQILAGALASYVTDSTLAGTSAIGYGFNSSTTGTGAKGYNVGSDGTAVGLVNNQTYTVLQLLQQANADEANGTFNANAFNDIFNGINTTGDIS